MAYCDGLWVGASPGWNGDGEDLTQFWILSVFRILKLLTAASSLQNGLEVFSFKESFYKLDIANAILVISKYIKRCHCKLFVILK